MQKLTMFNMYILLQYLKLTSSNLKKRNIEVDRLVLDHKDEIETLVEEKKVLEEDQLKLESSVATIR